VIVVGVDASEDAAAALGWAVTAAGAFDERVIAVHAVGLLEHERGDPEARHLLPDMAGWTEALDALPRGRVSRRLEQGDPVSALLRVAEDQRADLVVGTRGAGANGGAPLGSTSLALAENCPCPLVVVPRAR
jgi:nucleotide-binding universal stress UspA family protein